ncbi:MAG: PAS domain S-box protein [Desulfocucumaceae bacterium]
MNEGNAEKEEYQAGPKSPAVKSIKKDTGQSGILELFFSHTLSPLAILDRNFNFIRVNESYARADSREPWEFPGKNHFDLYPSDAREIFEHVVESKKPFEAFARPFAYAHNPERGVSYWDWTLVPVLDFSGEVEMLILSLNDVTRRVRAEEGLRKALMESRQDKQSLKNSEERFRSVAETASDAIISMDSRGNIEFWNRAAEAIFGYRADEAAGMPVSFLVPRRYRKMYAKAFTAMVSGEYRGIAGKTWEITGVNKDGRELPLEISVSEYKSEGKVFFTSIIRDITSRKMSEEAHIRLASIVESSEDAIISKSLDGVILSWNKGAEKIYGYSAAEAVGRQISILIPPGHGKKAERILDKMKRGEHIEYYESFRLRKDGSQVQVSIMVSPLKDARGRITGVSLIARDITERKRSEEALRLSENRFHMIFNMSPVMMSIISLKDMRFVDVNEYTLVNTGYTREEVVGKDASIIFYPVDDSFIRVRKKLDAKQPVRNENIRFKTKSEKMREGLVSIEIINLYGESCMLVVAPDITNQVLMEKEMVRLERLNLVGQMAAGIGHEIRNPMTAVRGFLQLLEGKNLVSQYNQYFKVMIDELDRANTIITEFLSLAKNKPVNMLENNINHVLEVLHPLILASAIESGVDFSMDLGDVPQLPLNENEIRQLILNMCRNGIESMPAGGKLVLRTYLDQNDLVLSVRDQGTGIEPGVLDNIGLPFLTTKDHGTGLGLAVCYGIAARHNARIDIETGSSGTTFNVRFCNTKTGL